MSTLLTDTLQTTDSSFSINVADLANSTINLANNVDPAKGAALVGYKGRTVSARLSDVASLKDYGAVMDGATDDSAELIAALAASDYVLIPAGVAFINANVNVPATKTLIFMGGSLSVANGVTVTVSGVVEAGWNQVFSGLGTVTGIRAVRPEWWGAKANDNTFDSLPAFQKALACVSTSNASLGGRQSVEMGRGEFFFSNTLVVTPKSNVNLHFYGQGSVFGTRLTAKAGFAGQLLLRIAGSLNALDAIADFIVENFCVSIEGSQVIQYGVHVGTSVAGEKLSGFQQSVVRGVFVEKFTYCWKVSQTRLVRFEHCSGWPSATVGAVGVEVTVETNGFTGDIIFDNCQFVASSATNGVNVYVHHAITNTIGGVGEIKGVKFLACTFYAGLLSVSLNVSNGGAIGDIWFTDCQCDGVLTDGFNLTASGTASLIDDVHITNQYIRGYTGTAYKTNTAGTSNVRDLKINGGWTANGARVAEIFGNVTDFNIFNHSMLEIAFAGPVIEAGGSCLHYDISHNRLVKVGGAVASTFIQLNGGGNGAVAVGNHAQAGSVTTVLQDNLGAVTKYIAGNI